MIVTKKTLIALDVSIVKWDAIAKGDGISIGSDNCELCMLHLKGTCAKCPIKLTTGETGCCNTPYDKFLDNSMVLYDGPGEDYGHVAVTDEAKRAAADFAKFMRDIRANCKVRVR